MSHLYSEYFVCRLTDWSVNECYIHRFLLFDHSFVLHLTNSYTAETAPCHTYCLALLWITILLHFNLLTDILSDRRNITIFGKYDLLGQVSINCCSHLSLCVNMERVSFPLIVTKKRHIQWTVSISSVNFHDNFCWTLVVEPATVIILLVVSSSKNLGTKWKWL